MSDEARKVILQRRARFVAAALASVALGTACTKDRTVEPHQCLSPPPPQEEDAGPPPVPCLEPPSPEVCLSQPPPGVCLSPPPPPQVCLEAPLQPNDDYANPPPGKS